MSLCRGGGWGWRVGYSIKNKLTGYLDIFSQLATHQLAPGPFEEHPCTRGHQTGHRNKPRGKQTEEEWTVKYHQLLAHGWTY